ncbi:MAG TPA: DUF2164 family protein [Caulobacteraceae bacterium]|nr:DUF2164 family protein [Caulobacteraceae bacterium]
MARIAFDKQTRDDLARRLGVHLKDEFGVEVGTFESLDLVDFLAETLGPYFYNQGLYDAGAVIKGRFDGVIEAVEAIEKPLPR